jgi:hypothetical protein
MPGFTAAAALRDDLRRFFETLRELELAIGGDQVGQRWDPPGRIRCRCGRRSPGTPSDRRA